MFKHFIMKKITSLFFMALCLCLFVGTAKAQTAADWSEGGIWYKVIGEGKVAVCQNPAGQDYTGIITIPATVTHEGTSYDVTAIGNRAFAYPDGTESSETVERVYLPSTIVSFGSCAFQWCSGLKEIVIPNTVTALWDNDFDGINDDEGATFMGCVGLEEITIGAAITDLAAPNGFFNPVGPNLKRVTCYAITPPTLNDQTFLGTGEEGVPLFVPEESLDAYYTDFWWNFDGPYAIGACLPPTNFKATITGLLTWTGEAGAYNLIISTTELDSTSLANYSGAIRVTETEYDAVFDATENKINYVYLRSDCGDEKTSTWVSTSFYYYTGATCDYTIQGDMYEDGYDPYEEWEWGWYGSHVQIVQNNIVIADIYDPIVPQPILLISSVPATFKWICESEYSEQGSGYLCWFRVEGAGGTLVEAAGLSVSADFGPVNIDCSLAIEKLDINNATSITPTLSDGFVTVNAEAGSMVKVTDLTGRLLKQETITRANQKVALNYANGVYLIVLEKNHSRFLQKVVLKK
jgi:hypothetical protein